MWHSRGAWGTFAAAGALGAALASAAPAVAAPGPGSAARRTVPRPDLVVSRGSVRASGGNLTGSFVVHNSGRGRAVGAASASLTARTAGRNRVLERFAVRALSRAGSRTVKVHLKVPRGLPAGLLRLRACADGRGAVRERSESNNCRTVGRLRVAGSGAHGPPPAMPPPTPAPGPASTPTPAQSPGPAAAPTPAPGPASSVPTDPIPFTPGTVLPPGGGRTYWTYVPVAYDATHATPMTLLVWSHGCGGQSAGDIDTVSPGGGQSWISIAVDGREADAQGNGGCWDPNSDSALLLAAIANVKTHFNIDPRRVILGGYSSGGDLSYRTAFYNSAMFAGVLAENTSPFRDTGSSQSASLAAATFKFHVVHVAHTEDAEYPIAGVESETDAMTAAGFPLTLIKRPGTHYDPDTATTGTDHDLRTYLLPHLDDGWLSP
jgi:predicted esterase